MNFEEHTISHTARFRARVFVFADDPDVRPLPWLALVLGAGGPVWHPSIQRDTADALRALADDVDRAWTYLDEAKAEAARNVDSPNWPPIPHED